MKLYSKKVVKCARVVDVFIDGSSVFEKVPSVWWVVTLSIF